MSKRIYLCLAHMSGNEMKFVQEAFDTNWVVPNPVKGLYYALERTEDLASGFNVNAYREATSVSVTFTVNESGNAAGRAFYRLLISACPPVE